MTVLAFNLLGGIGLFLLGMTLLTDGLKSFAGDALQRALARFTGTPLKAFASGALVTAMVQSSSATTVTVIGFVSAGLLTFPQAIGVVFGASLGTTGTGWIIATLGLKVSVGFYALPMVGVGAFLRLLARGRWASLGVAIAGFGVIFIGIETLQQGMRGLTEVFDLARLPSSGLLGHAAAMAIGVIMTVLMQSSSAAVATTLTAMHTGAVNFEQAASLVIGAAIGTTVTGALAAIGGSVPAKRTAIAHITFNLATGLIAMLLLPLFLRGIAWAQTHAGLDPGAMSLAAFHTMFIAVGVAIFLPAVHVFARLIERWLPERVPSLTRHLDKTLLAAPAAALEATRRALVDISVEMLTVLLQQVRNGGRSSAAEQAERLREAVQDVEEFLPRIPSVAEDRQLLARRVAQMHAIDHMTRLISRLDPPEDGRHALDDPHLQQALDVCHATLELGRSGLRGEAAAGWKDTITRDAAALAELRKSDRPATIDRTASGEYDPTHALRHLDAMRWLDRIVYHAWRICHYLGEDPNATATPLSPATAAVSAQPTHAGDVTTTPGPMLIPEPAHPDE